MGMRILIVEDDALLAAGIAQILQADGYAVDVRTTGAEALQAAERERFDLVLLDIGLPGMDGYEVARTIKEDPRLSGTTLVALTGYGQEADRRRSRSAGFSAHLVKPVDLVTVADLLAAG